MNWNKHIEEKQDWTTRLLNELIVGFDGGRIRTFNGVMRQVEGYEFSLAHKDAVARLKTGIVRVALAIAPHWANPTEDIRRGKTVRRILELCFDAQMGVEVYGPECNFAHIFEGDPQRVAMAYLFLGKPPMKWEYKPASAEELLSELSEVTRNVGAN